MTFEEAALLNRSEKVTLVTCEAEQLTKLFTVHSGSVYKREVEYFVSTVKAEGLSLNQVYSLGAIIPNSFFFDITAKTLYLKCAAGANPKVSGISIVYKFFFSNAPFNLPHDLANGEVVEWLPYASAVGSLGQQLDDDSTGIVLESNSSLDLINTEGFFDSIFDVFIWENKTVDFYSWFPITEITEAKKIFTGVIDAKDYGSDKVVFKVKDFVFKLKDKVNLGFFTELDGKITDSILNTPKRRIYGQAKQVKLVGVDNLLSGFLMSGTASVDVGSVNLSGDGTLFLKELNIGDEVSFTYNNENFEYKIETITSNTLATINKAPELSINAVSMTNNPIVPYRYINRSWHVSGHKLREPLSLIASVISGNRFTLNTVADLSEGDQILLNGDLISVRRVSGLELVTETVVTPSPSLGDSITKLPIQHLYFGNKELIYARDWTCLNTTEAIIQLDELAEFNITLEKSLGVNILFTNGSKTLTTSATVDLRTILKPRDWIKKNTIISGEGEWYEILGVTEQSVSLRTNYTGTTLSTTALIKNVDYIEDDSLMTCDCLGYENNGEWLKTPSDVVRHLVLNDAQFSSLNETSFTKAKADCDYIVSMVIPESIGSKPPTIRDCISKINESVFGSLYGDSSLSISYAILNSEKPNLDTVIKDDDILSFDTQSKTEIYNEIICNYRPFVDKLNGSDTFEVVMYNSGFVDKYIGLKNTLVKTLYLYEADKAEIIAQRLALFYSMASTKISIKGKTNFFLNAVNDKLFISFDRLFKRFGGRDRRKVGVITSIKKGQTETDITISDLGNIFNRVPSVAPNAINDYATASDNDKVLYGFVVDNDTFTPDVSSEDGLSCNLIG